MAATRAVEVGKGHVYHFVTSPFLLITLNKRFGREETNSLSFSCGILFDCPYAGALVHHTARHFQDFHLFLKTNRTSCTVPIMSHNR